MEAILKAPTPKNVTQLKSYLGMLNYYGKFIPNLSAQLHNLYALLRKESVFQWTEEADAEFTKSKEILGNSQLLVHYDPHKPLVMICDASPYGVGAVLAHKIDEIERPILFASSTLSDAEKNYSQLHREALAIIFGVKKFHKYLYGKNFLIVSDHQPLREIFNEKKSTPPVAAARLQRWSIILSMYQYKMEYRKGALISNADALSRLPLPKSTEIESCVINSFNFSSDLPLSMADIAKETAMDTVLSKIVDFVNNGWPTDLDKVYKPYFKISVYLAVENYCLFYGNRIAVPNSLKLKMLKVIHDDGQIGVVRMKALARSYAWWFGIDRDIELYVKECQPCAVTQNSNPKRNVNSWVPSEYPFERVQIDFFYLEQKYFLILVDSFSKWVEIEIMPNTTAEMVIQKLRHIFSIFGLPFSLVSDNGPPFNSHLFAMFCKSNGIKFITSPPYHPESNGLSERGVQTAKKGLIKHLIDEKFKGFPIQTLVDNFLIKYRNTPLTTTFVPPSELIFKYRPRTLIDLVKQKSDDVMDEKDSVEEIIDKSENCNKNKPNNRSYTQKKHSYNLRKRKINTCNILKSKFKKFVNNENVLYKNPQTGYFKWLPARIIKRLSTFVYEIFVNGNVRVAHCDQLKKNFIKNVNFAPTLCKKISRKT